MLWRECIPPAFYRFICQEDNFCYLNGWDVSQPGVLEIVGNSWIKTRAICVCFSSASPTIQIYFNTSTRAPTPKSTPRQRKGASTWRATSTFCSKRSRTRWSWSNISWRNMLKTSRANVKKSRSSSRSHSWSSTSSPTKKRRRSRSSNVRKIENVSSRLAMRNVWQSCKKKLLRTKKKRNRCGRNWENWTKNLRTLKSTKVPKTRRCQPPLFTRCCQIRPAGWFSR